jgi:hypothetical protein
VSKAEFAATDERRQGGFVSRLAGSFEKNFEPVKVFARRSRFNWSSADPAGTPLLNKEMKKWNTCRWAS